MIRLCCYTMKIYFRRKTRKKKGMRKGNRLFQILRDISDQEDNCTPRAFPGFRSRVLLKEE